MIMFVFKRFNIGLHNWLIYLNIENYIGGCSISFDGVFYVLDCGESKYKQYFFTYAHLYIAVLYKLWSKEVIEQKNQNLVDFYLGAGA